MLFEPKASDFEATDLENALLRTAVGDYAAEAAVLLLANAGHWLPQLAAAGLIAVDYDDDPTGPPTGQAPGVGWASVTWVDIDPALRHGRIHGSSGQLRILRAAASIADGQALDLGDVASGLDRQHLQLLLAAIAHTGGSHEHRTQDFYPHTGAVFLSDPLPSLQSWPPRD
ncbi:hypothetical protein [Modestobacter sp. Leaf380]|uniref:hypothetical protein n=1 Tax=Modestobacter sp. Leaf380 TaxID=1736356 RepID=UPI0019110AE9|nr:hypothetical protein [Modestobacter sp. Leaf380]